MTDTEALFAHPEPPTRPAATGYLARLHATMYRDTLRRAPWTFWSLAPHVPAWRHAASDAAAQILEDLDFTPACDNDGCQAGHPPATHLCHVHLTCCSSHAPICGDCVTHIQLIMDAGLDAICLVHGTHAASRDVVTMEPLR